MSELISKFPLVEQDPKLRDILELLFHKSRWGQIAKIPGIRTIHSSRAYPSDVDCGEYALGLVGMPAVRELRRIDMLPEVNQINPGDIIRYFGPWRGGSRIIQHIGIMIDSQIVRSKWNTGPVYEHPAWLVPTGFGNEVKIVRDL